MLDASNKKVIPIIPAESLIPKGMYCYTILQTPSEANGFALKTRTCPFWDKPEDKVAEYGDQMAGYCSYLKVGDWMEDGTDLLFDQCKACGINDDHYYPKEADDVHS